jgi:uncharacterized protein
MQENRNQERQESSSAPRRSARGFAAMDRERQRQIASEGGRAAHRQGVAHQWSSEEAREAGRKGGQNSRRNKRSESGSEQD